MEHSKQITVYRYLAILRYGFSVLAISLLTLTGCERVPEWERKSGASKSLNESQRFDQLRRWMWTCRGTGSHLDDRANRSLSQEVEAFVDHFRNRGLSALYTSSSKNLIGSAFMVSETGLLVSWRSSVEGIHDIECANASGRWISASLKGSDRGLDIAVLQLSLPADLRYRKESRWLTRSEPLALGENLYVLSSSAPGVIDLLRVSPQPARSDLHTGIDDALILFSPAPNLALAGGILVDEHWRVVGYHLYQPSTLWGAAVRVSTLDDIAGSIARKGKFFRPYLGLQARVTDAGEFWVSQVEVGGPAHQAGLRVQDRILRWDGADLKQVSDWKQPKSDDIARSIAVTYQRGAKTIEAEIRPSVAE